MIVEDYSPLITLTQFDGSSFTLDEKPKNIVSLVPSITENLILFGKNPVARTSFCIEPHEIVKTIPVVGGTKTPRVSKIISMKPDLVIANQEENIKDHIVEIQNAGIPVWVTFQKTVQEIPQLLRELESLCEKSEISKSCIVESENLLKQKLGLPRRPKMAALIWKNPWMAIGQETYTSDLIRFCGGDNPFVGRYPVVTEDDLHSQKIDILLLPTEPYAFESSDIEHFKNIISDVVSFSGEDLLWSGPRWIKAAQKLVEICKHFNQKHIK